MSEREPATPYAGRLTRSQRRQRNAITPHSSSPRRSAADVEAPSAPPISDDETPRPSLNALTAVLQLSPSRASISSAATSHSARTRSSSPSKTAQLAAAATGIHFKHWRGREDMQDRKHAPEATAIVERIFYQYARKRNVLSHSLKEDLKQKDVEDEFENGALPMSNEMS